MKFSPNKQFALEHLDTFIEKHISDYNRLRNFDFGIERRDNISLLSPYISHRVLLEFEIIKQILKKYSFSKVEKFIQEVFWRVYWKGWLELRPQVWTDFTESLKNFEKNENYLNAINGNTDIQCFNEWVNELKENNYLHNHTRMWFASIWIFTLKLPWQQGAAFFLEHLLDGDSASNTLSWRWVAGLQTKGKHYLAKSWNIEKFTENRFTNIQLNESAVPIIENKFYETCPMSYSNKDINNEILIVFDTDLFIDQYLNKYKKIYLVAPSNITRQVHLSEKVLDFKRNLINDVARSSDIIEVKNHDELISLFSHSKKFDLVYPFIGENLDYINHLEKLYNLDLNKVFKEEDIYCWQFSNKGYFNFKNNIPKILGKYII
ncbi:DNA photolyase [Pelagibacteraceae bacterium]|nr:DNA photolyase [Pelagibacteraceae bacterium]